MLESTPKQNISVKSMPADAASPEQQSETLSPQVLDAYRELANRNAIGDFELFVQPIGGPGENSFGSVLKVRLTPTSAPTKSAPLHTVLKVAPTSPARRTHMRVKDMYTREVFMYANVFSEFNALHVPHAQFSAAPQMLHASLKDDTEFIIFEDLTAVDFAVNSRTNLPTYDLVVCAFRALAQLHAMSFVLQARQPARFAALVAQMDDNLFTPDMEKVSVEFGKKYVRRTRHLLEADLKLSDEDTPEMREVLLALHKIEDHFHRICLDAVDGAAYAPYSVICHGDFWNNNILYNFDSNNKQGNTAIKAKLIDFQISRYSPPVLDLVHYLYACTEKPLRDAHFNEFMQIYYDTLAQFIRDYGLDPGVLYPEAIFRQQLRQFGVYGYCMSAFSVPFFVSNASELPDLDKVSEAIQELSSSESSDTDAVASDDGTGAQQSEVAQQRQKSAQNQATSTKSQNAAELVDELDILTERTLPIFKRRMIGNTLDMQKYEMLEAVLKY
uniref:CHK kinase-like domain-containing protein n=1 Tax=Bactrocera latifrons TaxID=174628 RepID=A0A0K8WBL9_BACLA